MRKIKSRCLADDFVYWNLLYSISIHFLLGYAIKKQVANAIIHANACTYRMKYA